MTSERLFNSFIHPKNLYPQKTNIFLATPLDIDTVTELENTMFPHPPLFDAPAPPAQEEPVRISG